MTAKYVYHLFLARYPGVMSGGDAISVTPVYNPSVNVVLLAFIHPIEKRLQSLPSKSLPFRFDFGFRFIILPLKTNIELT